MTIKVSTGIETSLVPNLEGKTLEEAKQSIEEAGLTLATTLYSEDTTKNDGTVLKQSLNAGDTVEKGSNITITVNKIEKLVTATISLNVKSILEGKGRDVYVETTAPDTGVVLTNPKTGSIEILADGDRIYYAEEEAFDKTNIPVEVTGKGTITIKVKVNGTVEKTTQINLNQETSFTIE